MFVSLKQLPASVPSKQSLIATRNPRAAATTLTRKAPAVAPQDRIVQQRPAEPLISQDADAFALAFTPAVTPYHSPNIARTVLHDGIMRQVEDLRNLPHMTIAKQTGKDGRARSMTMIAHMTSNQRVVSMRFGAAVDHRNADKGTTAVQIYTLPDAIENGSDCLAERHKAAAEVVHSFDTAAKRMGATTNVRRLRSKSEL